MDGYCEKRMTGDCGVTLEGRRFLALAGNLTGVEKVIAQDWIISVCPLIARPVLQFAKVFNKRGFL
jgi:lysylphosphatidylglycerol synthetase-like protein (DUF2156 family)